ncbi:hypothetical protein G4V62_05240 [Bacillaceae bacterium SIJ1]|uniref:hypothetical protein n=1 Tax=Litoribacterium kuwaitense TaxID=1398745 RepID=UPI0013EA87B7|nr:hypothetical protein [Litoribacterium kuwaitense]NGP44387.1 hypothetical protein [Litoribacterium kuwaitense]
MWFKRFIAGVSSGIFSGVILGLILAAFEEISGKRVYTLLLNIDFIPWLSRWSGNMWIEWVLHMTVAVSIGCIHVLLTEIYKWPDVLSASALTVIALFMYIPLSTLALGPAPSLIDGMAWGLWFLGHLCFCVSLIWSSRSSVKNA